jgi:hypothetical protein
MTNQCRKNRVKCRLLLAGFALWAMGATGPWIHAEIINNGTSTNQLNRLANPEETTFGSTTEMVVDVSGAYLVGRQVDSFLTPFPELRTVWFARNATATGAVYEVSAEFRPAAVQVRRQGGVMGWLDVVARRGLVFKVVPASGGVLLPPSFQVAHVDFTATTPEANENLLHLYNLDGTPATASVGSAWSPLGEAYQAGEFVALELSFVEPSAGEIAAVTNATVTARVNARAWQAPSEGEEPVQLGETIELLTTLPEPDAENHRMGYFGVWASGLFAGNDIGHYRRLEAEGAVLVQANVPPLVALVQPAAGASFDEPATITIEADASDPGGSIAQVEFFEGTNSLGVVTTAPYIFTWNSVAAGDYVLTAVATDNLGDSTTSDPVNVEVVPWSGTAPTLLVVRTGDSLMISWETTGFQLQYKTDLNETTWTEVADTVNATSATVLIESGARYFRLVRVTGPTGPVLSIQVSGSGLTVTWPAGADGYRLQAKPALGDAVWTDITTSGNQHTDTVAGTARFYRLISP